MKISEELKKTLETMARLDGADFMALASWLRQEGRAMLRERGATDDLIGPCRLDIDKFDDAPLG